MTNEARITELLEHILDTNCDVTSACQDCPELIPEVRRRLKNLRWVEQQLNELFPSSTGSGHSVPRAQSTEVSRLPAIPGYEIEGILGSGGMGVVYKARHQKLNRIVALKMLRAGQFATSAELKRFAREFQTIAELHCPHIVQIHDVGEVENRPFFTMEIVEGGSLAEKLVGSPQPARRSAELVQTLAEAIHSAHEKGIIHRDLKPANILLTNEGSPKIADFGLARHVECEQPLTISGMQLGTPSYMAPEQAAGPTDSLGPAVDIYSLGAILYEMLTGRPPFRADTVLETQRQVLSQEPVSPARINSSVPRDLETICLTCLSKEPNRRYASAGALAQDLNRFLRHEPIHARPLSRTERAWRWVRRNPTLAGLAITAFALITLAIVFGVREYSASELQKLESEKWKQRLGFVNHLEYEGRFKEARAILGRVPDGGSTELRHEIERAQVEIGLVERLDAIRISRGKFVQGGGIDYEESSRQYAVVFREAGIGSIDDEPVRVAEKMKSSTVVAAWVAALDDWAACAESETRAWILKVARISDPDPWRDQVRDQENWANLQHLQRLADSVNIPEQPITLLVAMGTRWRRLGGDPTAYLRRVHRVHPSDFWLNFELSLLYYSNDPASAAAYNLAALAIRPNAAQVHYNLALVYERLQRSDDANFHIGRTLELDPTHSWAQYRSAINLFNAGQSEDAIKHFRKALELDPDYKDAKNGLRIALVKQCRLEEAVSVWESTLKDSTATHADVDGIAELYLYLGKEDEYHRVCEVMLHRFGDSNDALVCERIGRACLLKPKSPAIQRSGVELIHRALRTDLPSDQTWAKPYLLFAKSLCDYRERRFKEAIEAMDSGGSSVLQPCPDLVLAMIYKKLGDEDRSNEFLFHAEEQIDPTSPAITRERWLFEMLRTEARLLNGSKR